jgi:SAM-dependent methyltransferase
MWPRLRHVFAAFTPPILSRAIGAVVGYVRWYPLLRGPSAERGAEWYDRAFDLSGLWKQHYSESSSYPMFAVIADRLVRRGVRSVLELGCGSGQLAALLRDKGIESYVGVDFSPRRIEQARRVCPEFLFHPEDILTSERLSQGGYDAVVANAFLEHVEADTRIVERVRPRTLFLGAVPNFPAPSHVRHFTEEAEVAERYHRFFTDFRTDSFVLDPRGRIVYLFEGVRTAECPNT